MEPTFSWNLDAVDFVPTGNVEKKKKREEEKKAVMPKETLAVCLIGPGSSGKSVVANALAGNNRAVEIEHGRYLNKDFKTRRYVIFDPHPDLLDQLPLVSISDFVVVVLKIDSIDENYVRYLARVLKNYVTTRLVVAVSHMDLVGWADARYFEVLNSVRRILDQNGLNDNVFVPVSRDQNIAQKVVKEISPWYNTGHGKSLILTLETLRPVQYKPDKGIKCPGIKILSEATPSYLIRLLSGSLSQSTKLIVLPSSNKAEIVSFTDSCGHKVDSLKAGDIARVRLRVPEEVSRTRGVAICEMHEKCLTSKEFRAEVVFFNLTEGVINPGFQCSILMHNAFEQAEVAEILNVYDLQTQTKQKVSTARNDQRATIIVKVASHICAENCSRGWDAFSKFALCQENRIVAIGKVLELHNKVEEIASEMGLF